MSDLNSEMVVENQYRGLVALVEALVVRVEALEARPIPKSRAEYMRKYRAKGKPNPEYITLIPTQPLPGEPPVSDTPPA